MKTADPISHLPGGDLIAQGLRDRRAGRCTIPSILLEIAHSRLTTAGVMQATCAPPAAEPERQLYRLLREEGGDAYSRYNALRRELDSFIHAFEAEHPRISGVAAAL